MNIAEREAGPERGRRGAAIGPRRPARGARRAPSCGRCFRSALYRRYRGRVVAALVALLVAAVTTLVVPIAVRRMIDFGFSRESVEPDRQLFRRDDRGGGGARSGERARYYLVTTLGERIVADLRSDVFGHLTALSAAFFDRAKTGELISRLTADTTQIKAAVGASVSIALRNLVLFIGAAVMMVVTSPRLSAFVLGAIPVIVLPLVGFGRVVRRARAPRRTRSPTPRPMPPS